MASDNISAFVYLALGFAMLVCGLSFLAVNDAVSHVPMFTLLFLRFSVATILLGIIGAAMRALAVSWRDLAVLAGLITASFIPVISLFAEVLILGTRLSLLKGLGTTVAIAGVLLVQTSNVGGQGMLLEAG